MSFLGLDFYTETQEELLKKITTCVENSQRLRISTINPEYIVLAQKNQRFLRSLENADVRVVDGVGLYGALWLRGFRGKRITGSELTEVLLERAVAEKWKVSIVLSPEGLSDTETVASVFSQKYPGLLCEVVAYGQHIPEADIAFVTLGAPLQEFVAEEVKRGVVIGVGGAVDFLVGTQKRAPRAWQRVGLEWLWRLGQNPRRVGRIWRATGVFLWIVIKNGKW